MAINGRLEPCREVEDIEHELEGLVCDLYGKVKQVMKWASGVGYVVCLGIDGGGDRMD
jgi:predicted phosphatase